MQRIWESSLGTVIEDTDEEEAPQDLEIIVETPMTVYVDSESGEVLSAEVWIDRRTPTIVDGPIKLSELDTVQKLLLLTQHPPTTENPEW